MAHAARTALDPIKPSSVAPAANSENATKAAAVLPYLRAHHWMTIGLISVGVIGRLTRYFLQFPLWGDEAMVCTNFLTRDYLELMRRLDNSQVAPVLFLWSQVTAVRLLGSSDLVMRLMPLLAGLAALGLFWRLAWSTMKPLPATLAVGLLAVARWPVTMSVNAKPYSFDLLMALVLLVPAAEWLRRPDRLVWLGLLALAVPIALLGSYPAVFVAGAVSVALAPTAWRSGWAGRGLFAAYNFLMAAGFAVSYWIVGREQLDPVSGSVNTFMQSYWAHGFPPGSPGALVQWLALIHTGRMMAYPVGGSDGLSTATFLLFAAGVWVWWKSGRRSLLALWLTPFVLNFLAAVLHRYPYGGCCRLSQHVAPAVCILAGLGAATLLEKWVRLEAVRLRGSVALCSLLGLCAIVGMGMDLARPYHDDDALWMRETARRILAQAGPDDAIVVVQPKGGVPVVSLWYLAQDKRVVWDGRIDGDRLDARKGTLWIVNYWVDWNRQDSEGLPPPQTPGAHGWTLQSRAPYTSEPRTAEDLVLHIALYHWVPPESRE